MNLHAVVPVKGLDHAKSRLQRVLSDRDRRVLAGLLLNDTLKALGCPAVQSTHVVTMHTEVAERARAAGAALVAEPTLDPERPSRDPHGPLNAALEAGRNAAVEAGAEALLTVPIDLILLPGLDLAKLLAPLDAPSKKRVTIETDDAGDGTNFLFQAPPSCVPFAYGPQSFARHQEAAEQRQIEVSQLGEPALRWDLDGPDDPHRLAKALIESKRVGGSLHTCFSKAYATGSALPFLLRTEWAAPLSAVSNRLGLGATPNLVG